MNDIPCKTCLVFPICKGKVSEYMKGSRLCEHEREFVITPNHKESLTYEIRLRPKCSILTEWIGAYVYVWVSTATYEKEKSNLIDKIHELFTQKLNKGNHDE